MSDSLEEIPGVICDELKGSKESRVAEIVDGTNLSIRQAELYILKVEEGHTIRSAAEKMGIAEGNASEKWAAIKEKIKVAKNTSSLDITDTTKEKSTGGDTSE